MTEQIRFQDNPSGVITDNKYKKHWLPKDSWGDLGEWRNYNDKIYGILSLKIMKCMKEE